LGFRQQAAARQGGATAVCYTAANVVFSGFNFLLYKNVVVFYHNGFDQIYCNDCCETSDEIESMALSDG
jgi:hypothetical protein